MRFNTLVIVAAVLVLLPHLTGAATGADVVAGDGTVINFDPSQNFIGNSGKPLTDSSASINALTYLTGADDPATITIRIINVALSFLGTLSLIFMLYAGYVWFTARDNEEEAKRAKQIIVGSVTGLAITLGAYGIAYLLFSLRGAV